MQLPKPKHPRRQTPAQYIAPAVQSSQPNITFQNFGGRLVSHQGLWLKSQHSNITGHQSRQVVRQDTLPAGDTTWTKPPPLPGQQYSSIPPRNEPCLNEPYAPYKVPSSFDEHAGSTPVIGSMPVFEIDGSYTHPEDQPEVWYHSLVMWLL